MANKVYIAGKITGDVFFRKKFERAAAKVALKGDIPLNPATLPKGMNPGDYMRICLSMIDSCDVLYALKDYVDSKGATIEILYASYIGKIVEFEPLEEKNETR